MNVILKFRLNFYNNQSKIPSVQEPPSICNTFIWLTINYVTRKYLKYTRHGFR